MAEWIGHFIANWPFWAVVAMLLIISTVWVFYFFTSSVTDYPWKKKEWWQDRHERLEKEAKAKRSKPKFKKGQ
jgi:fatty acid desaturase